MVTSGTTGEMGTGHAESCAAALHAMVASGGQDLSPCVHAFSGLLFTLAHRYAFPDPEEAVYHALLDIRSGAASWNGARLPARLWAVGIARRRFDHMQLAQLHPDLP
ncbi:hypothetical protein [Deinococcus sp.]|uniref:hypothetical protein n=1 Tax=Deinococcus sp. TaxID=47478 RepID=UPI002869B19B|nr:hypothetical protein [Deinococcus sp.]